MVLLACKNDGEETEETEYDHEKVGGFRRRSSTSVSYQVLSRSNQGKNFLFTKLWGTSESRDVINDDF